MWQSGSLETDCNKRREKFFKEVLAMKKLTALLITPLTLGRAYIYGIGTVHVSLVYFLYDPKP